jgi:hypothetical protein
VAAKAAYANKALLIGRNCYLHRFGNRKGLTR